MKKTNYLMTLLLTLALVLSMSTMALAESKSFTGDVTYDGGSSMKSNYDGKDIAASAADLEPGDDVTITITYNNRSQKTTDWYMRNSVLQTLEESGTPAENGGYTYTLTDSKAGVIYSNDEVGGNKQTGIPEGLKQDGDPAPVLFPEPLYRDRRIIPARLDLDRYDPAAGSTPSVLDHKVDPDLIAVTFPAVLYIIKEPPAPRGKRLCNCIFK